MEVVLDTNVAVSAAISPNGPPADIIRAWRAGSFSWVISEALLAELEATLRSPRAIRYIVWTNREIADFLAAVRQLAKLVEPTRRLDIIKEDPDDNRVVEAAVTASADYIVTGDKALLRLRSCEVTKIVQPARFLAVLEDSKGSKAA